ncbi:MAG: HD domain-containing protein [Treponema sp.]|nr:HD domain-containing protein [Treponema sp.]
MKVASKTSDKTMKIAKLTEKMIDFSKGNHHDITHFLQVWAFAKTIGNLEGLDEETQFILEAAALVHDIACPLCREKYGNTNGKMQEKEGEILVRDFFSTTDFSSRQIERIAYLVGHHHTFKDVDGTDYQILLEADYLENAIENNYSKENVENFLKRICMTDSGKKLITSVLLK